MRKTKAIKLILYLPNTKFCLTFSNRHTTPEGFTLKGLKTLSNSNGKAYLSQDKKGVPGGVFIDKEAELKEPCIIDIVPTILRLFNIPKPKAMQGKELF